MAVLLDVPVDWFLVDVCGEQLYVVVLPSLQFVEFNFVAWAPLGLVALPPLELVVRSRLEHLVWPPLEHLACCPICFQLVGPMFGVVPNSGWMFRLPFP